LKNYNELQFHELDKFVQWCLPPQARAHLLEAHQSVEGMFREPETHPRHTVVAMLDAYLDLYVKWRLIGPEFAETARFSVLHSKDREGLMALLYRVNCTALRVTAALPVCPGDCCCSCLTYPNEKLGCNVEFVGGLAAATSVPCQGHA
jgi:hypothetical protein